MPSDLQVSNLKDLTGSNTGLSIASDGQVSITQDNPTLTLGANTTFPSGMIVKSTVSYGITSTAELGTDNGYVKEAVGDCVTHTGYTVGNSLLITLSGGWAHGLNMRSTGDGYAHFGMVIYNSADNSELHSGFQSSVFVENTSGSSAKEYMGVNTTIQTLYTPASGVTSIKIGRMAGGDSSSIYGLWDQKNDVDTFGDGPQISVRIDEIKA
jgi:hypothetical protein